MTKFQQTLKKSSSLLRKFYVIAITVILLGMAISLAWLTTVFFEISPAVWASIVASILTLSGVILTNKHDSKQKDRDRNLSLLREIYLNAVGAISQWQSLLARLTDLDFAQSRINDELAIIVPMIARVNVVGNNETIQAVSRLVTEMNSLFLELSLKRLHLIKQRNEIALLGDQILKCLEEQKKNELNQLGFNFWKKECESYDTKQDVLHKQHIKELCDFLKFLNKNFLNVSDFFTGALVAVRNELEFPIDVNVYKKTLEESFKKTEKDMNSFLAEMEKSNFESPDSMFMSNQAIT